MDRREHEFNIDRDDLGKSFFLKNDGPCAIMLVHGWSSVPYEMHMLAHALHDAGFSVSVPCLRGHGTEPEHLEGVVWQDWKEDVLAAYDELAQDYSCVFVGGMSTGGSLTIHLAAARPDVAGLILMATPHSMRYESLGYWLTVLVKFWKPYKKKYYPKIWGSERCMTEVIAYKRYPYTSAFEAFYAIKSASRQLHHITQPCMLIQSNQDHLVSKRSLEAFASSLKSDVVHVRKINRAYHNFIADKQHDYIFEEIVQFLQTSHPCDDLRATLLKTNV